MIQGVDSSGFHPTLAQVQAAYAQGIRVWGKYLPGPGIYSGDTKADYDLLKAGGMKTIAFCSGWADPAQQKALGASWGVDHICLDVENGIRGDGSWVQGWLNTSGAGLYGSQSVSWGRTAPLFIMAAYPGYDPGATWSGQAPSVPHGWQWAGSVSAFGGAVDRSWLDDWFGGTQPQGDNVNQSEKNAFVRLAYVAGMGREPESQASLTGWANQITDTGDNVELIVTQILDSTESTAWRARLKAGVPGPVGPAGPAGTIPSGTVTIPGGSYPVK